MAAINLPKDKKLLSICAVIAVRNEAPYLRILLPILAEQNIDVVILDNESTDESREIYSSYLGNPIIEIREIPFRGSFSLFQQLEEKRKIINQLEYDWVLHHDADEILEHNKNGLTLRDAVEEADERGYNALNFDEFVFLPEPTKSYHDMNFYKEYLRYYFFEPQTNRLNRAWKRSLKVENIQTGGHKLLGANIAIYPANHVLRHFIVLDYAHAKRKYLNKTFDGRDLGFGWHGNRLNFTAKNLMLPKDSPFLFQLESYNIKDFFKGNPATKHYWDWEKNDFL